MTSKGGRELDTLDDVASVVEKLAVLLSAGVAPVAAWTYLAETKDRGHDLVSNVVNIVVNIVVNNVVNNVVNQLDGGATVADAILVSLGERPLSVSQTRSRRSRVQSNPNEAAWRGLAAAWTVATEAGAPLAQALQEFSGALRSLAQASRDASTALSGPVATAKLVMVLPIVGVLFGLALGFDTIGTLFTTPPGLVCLVLGCTLLWLARLWNRKLVHAATPTDLTPGLTLDLLAVAVSGGASIDRARATVTAAFTQSGCGTSGGTDSMADEVFDLSRRAGVPAGTLLRSEAHRVRRQARSAAERNAATLAVTLMLPLGLCVLPAFMLLGVAPLMMSVFSSTLGGLS